MFNVGDRIIYRNQGSKYANLPGVIDHISYNLEYAEIVLDQGERIAVNTTYLKPGKLFTGSIEFNIEVEV